MAGVRTGETTHETFPHILQSNAVRLSWAILRHSHRLQGVGVFVEVGMNKHESEPQVVAWRVEINDMSCIVFASTKAKANWIAVKGYWNAGYGRGPGNWPRPKAARAHRFDKSRLRHDKKQVWSYDYVMSVGDE